MSIECKHESDKNIYEKSCKEGHRFCLEERCVDYEGKV
jgi:hypothetical protein